MPHPIPNEPVLLTRDGPVATLLPNRPEKLNAINDGLREGLARALSEAEQDCSIRVLVITGAGRGFCAGGDIEMMLALTGNGQPASLRQYLQTGHEVIRRIRQTPKPVLASVNGPAAGAGMNLALACDLRIASGQASFSQAFVRIGLHPDWGGTFFLPQLIGTGRALEMFVLGDTIGAAQAHQLGLVNFLVTHDKLAEETHKLAVRLAAAPALPVALLKQELHERTKADLDRALERELEAQVRCFESADFREGIQAFIEKRKPDFKGA